MLAMVFPVTLLIYLPDETIPKIDPVDPLLMALGSVALPIVLLLIVTDGV